MAKVMEYPAVNGIGSFLMLPADAATNGACPNCGHWVYPLHKENGACGAADPLREVGWASAMIPCKCKGWC